MRRFLLTAAKILVSAALLYFSLRETHFGELAARLNAASAGWLVLAIAVAVFQIYVAALRWCAIGAESEAPLGTLQAFRYSIIGNFFNQTLPSSIGGDAMRLWLVARAGAGWRAATYSVFVDRAIGLMALAALILFALPWSLKLIDNPQGRLGVVLLDLAAVGAGAVFLLLSLVRIDFLTRIWATRHFYACSQIANRVLFNGGRGLVVALVSLAINVLAVVVAWCVARAIAAPADLVQLMLLFPPVMLITMIPISIAGWGVREASLGLAFSYAGLGASEGVNVSLLFGAVYFIVGAAGGLIWVVSAEKGAKGEVPLEAPE